jgi:hypothetical protein
LVSAEFKLKKILKGDPMCNQGSPKLQWCFESRRIHLGTIASISAFANAIPLMKAGR